MPYQRLRLALLTAPLLALAITVAIAGAPSGHEISRTTGGAGTLAPLAFIPVYVGWTVLMFPGSVLTVAAGALSGFVLGSGLALVGAEAGATAAYLVARRVGAKTPANASSPRAQRLERWLAGNGLAALLSARLMPGVPFNLLNYVAGVTGVPTRTYVIATAIGIVPGMLAYAALGWAMILLEGRVRQCAGWILSMTPSVKRP